MREYLFRGQTSINSRWVYGNYTPMNHKDKTIHFISSSDLSGITNEVNGSTIGQFTGQKDLKEVNRIFEGDKLFITGIEFGCTVPEWFTGDVRFIDGSWLVCNDDKGKAFNLFQELGWWMITGNIHDK